MVEEMSGLIGIRGRSRRERIRNEKAREELGAEETVIEKIKRRRRFEWLWHVFIGLFVLFRAYFNVQLMTISAVVKCNLQL